MNSGRGGAGNYISRKEDGGHDETPREKSASSVGLPPLKITSNTGPAKVGFTGRGGAGNLRTGEAQREERETKAREARERAHEEVVRDVEMGLKMPERAHLSEEKVEKGTCL